MRMKRLILVFFLCILMAPVINATAVEQYLSADYHGEKYVVFYLPDLTDGDGVWACDGFDYDIVNVTVTPHPVGRMTPGSVPKYVYQLKIEGLSAGFAFVTVDLTSKDQLAWRYNFFVEVDDALNVVIRYAELQRGEGDITDVTIDYGHSEHFTQEQMEKAVQVILNDFKSWTGYVLHDITYKKQSPP